MKNIIINYLFFSFCLSQSLVTSNIADLFLQIKFEKIPLTSFLAKSKKKVEVKTNLTAINKFIENPFLNSMSSSSDQATITSLKIFSDGNFKLRSILSSKIQQKDKEEKKNNIYTKILTDTVILPFHSSLAAVRLKGKWGFVNNLSKLIIPAIYDSIGHFSEGLASFYVGTDRDKNGKLKGGFWGFIDKNGKKIIQAKYFAVKEFSQGFASVQFEETQNGSNTSNYINKKGEQLLPENKYIAESFLPSDVAITSGLFISDELINTKGEVVAKYGKIKSLGEGLFLAQEDFKGTMIVDSSGRIIVNSGRYNRVSPFNEGFARVGRHDVDAGVETNIYGFINNLGKEIIGLKYEAAGDVSDGIIIAKLNKKYHALDVKGNDILPVTDNFIANFSEGMAALYENKKFKFINRTGEKVINKEYNLALPFSEGLAAVNDGGNSTYFFWSLNEKKMTVGGKWGFIDKKGKLIIEMLYDGVSKFENGLAIVRDDKHWFYINKDGNDVAKMLLKNLSGK